ncbi:phage tail sheath family protein [Kutzneria sp. NPDC052558]|uniref:phage tail sheath family protein n=1 Tax=Kutzneria sp. NPDC052558 TaxID=3364121 RepID=UPI0037C57E55
MTAGLRLGAPGIYQSPHRVEPAFTATRLDVTGFVGVAPRGPVNETVAVFSWSDYQQRFGAFQGRGRLPYAVQAFFAQGGAKAQIVRVAPAADDPDATSRLLLSNGITVSARDEGSWGDLLSVTIEFTASQHIATEPAPTGLRLLGGASVVPGSLLLTDSGEFRWVISVVVNGGVTTAVTDKPVRATGVSVITADVSVVDGDPTFVRQESFAGLGLRPEHPQFLLQRLESDSLLVRPTGAWKMPLPLPDLGLSTVTSSLAHKGKDRWSEIDRNSFFSGGAADDPLNEEPHRGIDVAGRNLEIGLLVVPDLYWSWDAGAQVTDPPDQPPACGCFRPCAPDPAPITYTTPPQPDRLLDGRDPGELAEILVRQKRVVEVAALRQRFVALLDVPFGLPVGEVIRWRSNFDTSYAAAYFPWLAAVGPDTLAVQVPPSAYAAGIIAAREIKHGLPWGPANELAVGAVQASDHVSDAEHDRLHLAGVNVYRAERDGFRLTAARTVSSDPDYRQLSVRRLMTMIAITLARQAQFLVFEPNTPQLRDLLGQMITHLLRGLKAQGAFSGDTEQQCFFVLTGDSVNPPQNQQLGRLVAEVGVAPSTPLEYLVLRITQDGDGAVRVEADNG